MRIIALTFGTEGDTRPMVALCRGLHDAGHDVLLLAERNGAAYADALDVPFVPLAGDMAVAMRTAAAGVSRRGADVHYVARTLAAIAAANTGEWLRAALAHAHGRDLVLCAGLAIYVGFSAAEALRIRAIGVGLQPMMPTRAFASPFLPPLPLPRFVNRASHWLVLSLMWRAFRGPINAARRDVAGQALRARAWDDYPVLFGVSPTLVPRPDDWTDRVAMSGYWFGPRDPRFVADRDLVEFIDACEAPVYVGFGSMLGFDHARLLDVALRALAGRRAILHAGWSGFGEAPLPRNVRRVAHVPHDWLFPKMSTIVHHGGAGTTHTAARAGVPSVVLPFAADQFFWARRLESVGVAPEMLTHRRLSAGRLRERLDAARAPAMQARARGVGAKIAAENGVADGVAQIEAWMRDAVGVTMA
ncbi:MAG TPA: glycosyltransferase [Casimicrobiaceae bacterium]|nr:glycosyltransferase [Casimicrobiaceae bacterium]